MTELDKFSNEELAALAAHWRTRALHGERDANGRAHELEREIRRRADSPSIRYDQVSVAEKRSRLWWAFWRK